eukprot:1225118-Pyramimonas_sp.AAC.1
MHCLSKLLHRDCWRLDRLLGSLALLLLPGSVVRGDDRFVRERMTASALHIICTLNCLGWSFWA